MALLRKMPGAGLYTRHVHGLRSPSVNRICMRGVLSLVLISPILFGARTLAESKGERGQSEERMAQLLCFQFMVKALVLFPRESPEANCLLEVNSRWMDDIRDGDDHVSADHCNAFLNISAEVSELRFLFSSVVRSTDAAIQQVFAPVIAKPRDVPLRQLCPAAFTEQVKEEPTIEGIFTGNELVGFVVATLLASAMGFGVINSDGGRLNSSSKDLNTKSSSGSDLNGTEEAATSFLCRVLWAGRQTKAKGRAVNSNDRSGQAL